MRLTTSAALVLLLSSCSTMAPVPPSPGPKADAYDERVQKLVHLDGFLPLYRDEKQGKIYLEIARPGEELIYQVSLASGVGSNDIGLDRGQLGDTAIVRFDRQGPRVLMVEPNQKYRALGGSAGEKVSVEESFATSVLWSFKIEEESGGRLLVDATDFFLRDAHGVAARLRDSEQGSYSVDASRSEIYVPRTKAFPLNTEVEALITLTTTGKPGRLISSVTPSPEAVTVREHHSFVALPAPGYVSRELDPRTGFSSIEIYDYSSSFAEPLEKRFIERHRLQKKDPASPSSDVVKPIIYYVDNAAPEPIRSALLEGASWWKEAFEKAGFHNGFDVRILPADADPMDIRYNVINWVHRSSRGWSYGSSVTDPRTGEILKGDVTLGSLRIRQDVMIASGLIAPFEGPDPEVLATLDPSVSPTAMALARIRQLAAHEVGHTLGLAHNFAASTYDRGSVMDYPAPLVKINGGKLDLSDAYGRGLGSFDLFSIRWGYSEFAPGSNEASQLAAIVHDGLGKGLLFVADEHARDPGSAHPLGAVWDNGSDPIASLRHEMEVRRIALENFGLGNLRPGRPLSDLEPLFLPLYLHHRYQLEAALKSLGGAFFTYAMKEGTSAVPAEVREVVDAGRQREAMKLALDTLEPSFLAIPQRILDLIPPPASGFATGTPERFARAAAPLFDPIAAAQASASITLNALLHPERAARLARFHAENQSNPSIDEVTSALLARIARDDGDGTAGALRRAVRSVAVTRLIEVAGDARTDPAVRSGFEDALRQLARQLEKKGTGAAEIADRRSTIDSIQRFLSRSLPPQTPAKMPEMPPGPPIGD